MILYAVLGGRVSVYYVGDGSEPYYNSMQIGVLESLNHYYDYLWSTGGRS